MLVVDHASLNYLHRPIFTELHFTVQEGEWLAIMGKSGVGKTSLLRLIAGLNEFRPEAGTSIAGQVTWQGKEAFTAAYMAQQDGLFPWLTVEQNVCLPFLLKKTASKKQKTKEASALIKAVKLSGSESLKPAKLSGGMRQRVALARTLIQHTELVLMDEPFSALDAMTRLEMQALSFNLLYQAHKTVVMVTHDPWEALRLADKIIVLAGAPAKITASLTLPKRQILRDVTDASLLPYYQELLGLLVDS